MAEHRGPVRTCIGCRARAPWRELRRYVLADGGAGRRLVHLDADGTAQGRGAWLHDDAACRQLAIRRRAVRRALRIAGDVEVDIDLDVARTHDGDGHVVSPAEEADGSRR